MDGWIDSWIIIFPVSLLIWALAFPKNSRRLICNDLFFSADKEKASMGDSQFLP